MLKKAPEVIVTNKEIFRHLRVSLGLSNIVDHEGKICFMKQSSYPGLGNYPLSFHNVSYENGERTVLSFVPLSECIDDPEIVKKIEFMYKALEYLEKQMPKEE